MNEADNFEEAIEKMVFAVSWPLSKGLGYRKSSELDKG